MKKIDKFKGKRYYQSGMGIFIDIERYRGDTVLSMGSWTTRVINLRDTNIPVVEKMKCCEFAATELTDEECMEAFEKVYWKFESKYIFCYICDDFGIQPFDNGYESIEMNDFYELEITRYKHKHRNKLYYLDVVVRKDPNDPEIVYTYVYIKPPQRTTRYLCDNYAYEVPEGKYEEMLNNNFDKYIATLAEVEDYGDYLHICFK